MSEQPATLASEARKIHQGLKDLLKSKEPSDKELDFQRKNLRRRYLHLLLVHPYAPEAKDAENHLWMQTSYAFISAYKQRVAALDRQTQPKQQGRNNGPVVEYRKLLQRFRQFLAEEEKFWTQFLVRFSRSFALQEAEPALIDLGILTTRTDGKVIEHADPADHGRNHFQFPADSSSPDLLPKTQAQHQSRMVIVSKGLICLGDIARYREQYNESGGRPRAGHDDSPGPSRRGRTRRANSTGSESVPRPRNFEKSRHCYEQARSLVPDEGNPSHQLAILSNYQKDPFASLVHYYRALCVQQPYDTASENMGTVLNKTFEQWKQKDTPTKDPLAHIPKVRIEALKEKEVVVHALWRIALDKTDPLSFELMGAVHNEFKLLVSERHLPEDLIIDFVILSQSALWNLSTSHERSTNSRSKSGSQHLQPAMIEARILSHILSFHKALLNVGIDQLKEPPPVDAAENDLAQRITAVFRRTLPALRIASKWLIANYEYLTTRLSQLQNDVASIDDDTIGLSAFWDAYTHFSRSLSRAFPIEKLPTMAGPLDEDTEMRGFLPLQGTMKYDFAAPKQDQVHPNVLQLMRISDLLSDTTTLVHMQDSPIALYGNHFVLKGVEAIPVASQNVLQSIRDSRLLGRADEDALTELTSRTEDDPVRDAFRHLDTSDKEVEDEEEAEEDEIVYLRSPVSPPTAPLHSPTRSPRSPVKQNVMPSPVLPVKGRSPYQTPTIPVMTAATTAQDLLNSMMNRSPTAEKSAKPASLLFGSEPRQSIWSVAQDEQPFRLSSGAPLPSNHTLEPSSPYLTASPSRQLASQSVNHHRTLSSMPSHTSVADRGNGNSAFLYSSSQFLPASYSVQPENGYISQPIYPASPPEGQHTHHLSFQDHRPMFVPGALWGGGGGG